MVPQGNADASDRDNIMVACREAAEETGFALGPPRHLKVTLFDGGRATRVFRGCWLVDLGPLSAEARDGVVRRHVANTVGGAFWRRLHHCEMEMEQLRWVPAEEVLAAFARHRRSNGILVPSLGSPFRSWTTPYYQSLVQHSGFRAFCERGAGAAGALELLEPLLHAAKHRGNEDAIWLDIFERLSACPELVNSRGGRSYTLLHHAAFWGQLHAVQRLVGGFGADVHACSGDGRTPAEVAAQRGHKVVMIFLQDEDLDARAKKAARTGG